MLVHYTATSQTGLPRFTVHFFTYTQISLNSWAFHLEGSRTVRPCTSGPYDVAGRRHWLILRATICDVTKNHASNTADISWNLSTYLPVYWQPCHGTFDHELKALSNVVSRSGLLSHGFTTRGQRSHLQIMDYIENYTIGRGQGTSRGGGGVRQNTTVL